MTSQNGAKNPRPRIPPYVAIVPICAGVFIAADDQTVIVTVLPQIMLDLKVQITELDRASWTITGYLLGYVAAMPLIGRMSDVWGHRNLYVASMLMFMAGSVLAALTTDLTALVAARVFQAVGAGALVPISIAMVGDLFPSARRGVPLGIVGASAEAGGVIGPLWGGIIIRYLDWPWVFWINIPLGILVLVFLVPLVGPSPRFPAKIDYMGGVLLAVCLSTLTLGLARVDAPDELFGVYVAVALISLVFFVIRQRGIADPLLPMSMFRSRPFNAANGTHLLIGAALIIGMVTIPLMANTVLGRTPLEGGLMLMRMTAAVPIGAVLGGIAAQRLDYRVPTMLGLALIAVGFGFMSRWDLTVSDPSMTVHLALAGFGFGLLIAPVALAATNSVDVGLRGAAAALITAMRMVGMTFGLATLTAWGTGRFQDLVAGMRLPLPLPGDSAEQAAQRVTEFETQLTGAGLSLFSDFYLIAMAVSLIAIAVAAFMAWKPTAEDEAGEPGQGR
ncbi:MAG: MFS transporter [SAR202 cluster bacterium]|nr:MFS transporter [SAR202 cluster bacterium]MDP6664319.1 MFS transporter [SAR202 cluster bacterium]MDP6798795.1 MFS transporter [SAR202 cluster bacterium]